MKTLVEYPFIMCRADALTPQRFWSYVQVTCQKDEAYYLKLGYVISNKEITDK